MTTVRWAATRYAQAVEDGDWKVLDDQLRGATKEELYHAGYVAHCLARYVDDQLAMRKQPDTRVEVLP